MRAQCLPLLLAFALSYAVNSRAEVVVAIIDTGADVTHPALQSHVWVNPGESGKDKSGNDKSANGIDDDANGFVDDVNGWNFTNDTNQVTDNHGHGTHIAGIIAAQAPRARLMVLKYFDPQASGEKNQASTNRAIAYATKMRARVINYSAGGVEASTAEKKVIQEAAENNIVFIAAAGNEHSNSDFIGFYPASYDLPNIISVTAIDASKSILPSSNFGRRSVDIAATGKSIFSSTPGGKAAAMTGTSQATAFVSGAAALLLENHPEITTPEKLKPYLLMTSLPNSKLSEKTKTGGALDITRSLQMKGPGLSPFGGALPNVAAANSRAFTRTADLDLPFRSATEASANSITKP